VAPPRKPLTLIPRQPKDFGFSVRLSPDNKWIAYDIDESGRSEVYVLSFPDGHGKTQVSTSGGIGPKWVRGGKEIIYQDFDGQVMSVEVDTSHGVRAGTPKRLFQLPEGSDFGWDVTADGERFLVNAPVIKSSSVPLNVIVNWTAALKK
jgi:hypothetical protein